MHQSGDVQAVTRTFVVNEVFASLQGEGVRAGTANVFVRFSGCNLACSMEAGPRSPGNFDCDTEFVSGRKLTLTELHNLVIEIAGDKVKWLILTGGEPALQVDKAFCDYFHAQGYMLAIETNGSIELPKGPPDRDFDGNQTGDERAYIDWITVSPKVAEHCIRQKVADEVKYVRGYGQGIPKTVVKADHYLISPAFNGTLLDTKTLDWCVRLCLDNPQWRLSVQQHKQLFGGIR